MEDLEEALNVLNGVLEDFPVGADSTQSVNFEDFDKLEKVFNVKKADFSLNVAYKEDVSIDHSRSTCSSTSEALQDYLKEKYIKECRDLSLRNVVEMLSLHNVFVGAEGDGNQKHEEIKRRLMKLNEEILELSEREEDFFEIEKLNAEKVSKEMELQELKLKYLDVASKLEAKGAESLETNGRLVDKTKSMVDEINFMKCLTVNLIGCSSLNLKENPELMRAIVDKCQPIQLKDVVK